MRSSWARRLLGEGWPWAVSVLLHGVMVSLALGAAWSTLRSVDRVTVRVPVVQLATGALGMPRPQAPAPAVAPSSQAPPSAAPAAMATEAPPTIPDPGDGGPATAGGGAGLAGAEPVELPLPSPKATASPLAGLTSQPPLEARFYGTGGRALRVVYVVDASASLVDTMKYVLAELRQSLSQLQAAQHFTVIFFQEGKALEPPPGGMRRATSQNVREVETWFSPEAGNVRPHGTGSLVEAVARALAYDPDLIFVLSDNLLGPVPADQCAQVQEATLRRVRELNHRGTMINTIQFIYEDPLKAQGMAGTLERLAQESGGLHRFVSAQDLGIQ